MSAERRAPPRISASRIAEILAADGARSLVDPLIAIPVYLGLLAEEGIRIHGAGLVDWYVAAGAAIVAPPAVPLGEHEVAALVERDPGRDYDEETFFAWEGAFFSEEQCRYLAVWRENVRALPDAATRGLAVWGLWHVLCFWLTKAEMPDGMLDIPPSELAWEYLLATSRWTARPANGSSIARTDALDLIRTSGADALFVAVPPRNERRRTDPRIWMWEAWWQGDPYFDPERSHRGALLGERRTSAQAHDAAIARLLAEAHAYPLVILHAASADAEHLERSVRESGRAAEQRIYAPNEAYVIARAG